MDDPKSFRKGVEPTTTSSVRAGGLRRGLSPPERRLWLRIKGKQLDGLRFRKQAPIGVYVADFYCHGARLVVEIDGGSHQGERLARDAERDRWMEGRGICVLRFRASEVRDELEGVLLRIREVGVERVQLRDGYKDGR